MCVDIEYLQSEINHFFFFLFCFWNQILRLLLKKRVCSVLGNEVIEEQGRVIDWFKGVTLQVDRIREEN